MEGMLEKNIDDDEEIKRKDCEKSREKLEKLKYSLKKIKEEFKKKTDNKDMILSMIQDFMENLEEFKSWIQLRRSLFVPLEVLSFIEEFKEPPEFFLQEREKMFQKYENYTTKKKNFKFFAEELKKCLNSGENIKNEVI